MERARLMGYVLSILMNALQTWLFTKLWDSFFTRRFNGKKFWAYWLLWTAIITVVLNVLPNDYDYSNIIRFLIEIAHEYAMSLMLYRSRWDRRLFVVITGYACFFFYFSTDRKGMAALFGYDADGVCI